MAQIYFGAPTLTMLVFLFGPWAYRLCVGAQRVRQESIGALAEDAFLVQRELPHHGRDDRVDRRHGARRAKLKAKPEHGDFSWVGG